MVPLEAVIESRAPAPVEAMVAVAIDGGEPRDVPATLLPGLTVVALPHRARGAGRHVVRLDDGAPAPGLYWAVLAHGSEVRRQRVAVVR